MRLSLIQDVWPSKWRLREQQRVGALAPTCAGSVWVRWSAILRDRHRQQCEAPSVTVTRAPSRTLANTVTPHGIQEVVGSTPIGRLRRRPPQVVEVDDVVAAQHRRRAMSRKRHDGVWVDAAVDQVLDATPPEVMHQATAEADRGARALPKLPEVSDRLSVAVEDVLAVEAPGRESAVDHCREGADEREHPAMLVLAVLRSEPDGLLVLFRSASTRGA